MENKLTLRSAIRGEIYNVAEFLHISWQTEYRQIVEDGYLDAMTAEERYKGLIKRFDEKASDFLLLYNGDLLIGAVVFGKSFTEGYSQDGEISAIYLKSEYIGYKHGHRLFTEAENRLAQKGYVHIILDVLSENKRAVNFYVKHGYKPVDYREVILGGKSYPLTVMRK